MLGEALPEHDTEYVAIRHVGAKLGVGPETLRTWKRSSEVDSGVRPGVMSDEHAEIRRFKRENAELRRAKEILKSASASFRGGTRRPTTR